MSFWLVYERCKDCDQENCLQCHKMERELTLRVVQAENMPENSLNGPCRSAEEVLQRMGEFFFFDDQTGFMHFKFRGDGE